jgi:hypothetical protein
MDDSTPAARGTGPPAPPRPAPRGRQSSVGRQRCRRAHLKPGAEEATAG